LGNGQLDAGIGSGIGWGGDGFGLSGNG
jgi:hypothetical protein